VVVFQLLRVKVLLLLSPLGSGPTMGFLDNFPHEWFSVAKAPVVIGGAILLLSAAVTSFWRFGKLIAKRQRFRALLAYLPTVMDREAVAKEKREELGKQIEELKTKVAAGSEKEELTAISARIEAALADLRSAENAASDALSASMAAFRTDKESLDLGRTTAELQQDSARLDLELKRLELQQKLRPGLVSNPIFLAAVITAIVGAMVSVATGVSSYIATSQQRTADAIKAVLDSPDSRSMATKLGLYLDTGVVDQSFRSVQLSLEGQFQRNMLLNILRASNYEPLELSSKASGSRIRICCSP
jgi:hypothetical protein